LGGATFLGWSKEWEQRMANNKLEKQLLEKGGEADAEDGPNEVKKQMLVKGGDQ
jgi:hypothetical protein